MSVQELRALVDAAKVVQMPRKKAHPQGDNALVELDMNALAQRKPEPPKFIVPEWLPAGEVTLLAGHGGTGKSATALRLATCVALGLPFHGLPTERRFTSYVSFEDSTPVLHWRLSRICNALGIELPALQGCLRVFDGSTSSSAWYGRRIQGDFGITPDFNHLAEQISGSQFIVVDGSSDVFAGNENDRSQVKAFIRGLRSLVPADGALLLLAHVDKAGAAQGSSGQGFSGSTGWNNGVRCRWYLYPETDSDDDSTSQTGNVVLEVRKSNLGKTGAGMRLRFDEQAGVFERADSLALAPRGKDRDREEVQAIVEVIRAAYTSDAAIPAATAGTRTAHTVAQAHEGFPDSLKGKRGRHRFHQHLEKLRASGRVVTESVRSPSRKYFEVLNVREAFQNG